MKTISINENISLHYIEMKKLKTTVVGTYIRRKLSSEENALNAVLPYVLKSGCKKFPSISDITKHLQDLYGASLNAGVLKNGDNQVIFFDAETISDKYTPSGEKPTAELISLLMEILFVPQARCKAFNEQTVNREKKTVKDRIDALINDKRSYAQLRCTEEICKNDVFGLSKFGTKEQIDLIDKKNLYAHYEKIITSSQIDIFVCGEANCDELVSIIKNYTKKLSFIKAEYEPTKIICDASSVNKVTDNMDVTQGKLSIGFTTGINAKSPDYPAMVIANSIYGAGTHSKLFNNVREKLSLAYYASSSLNKYKGIMIVNAGIEFENFKKAYDEAISQLDELKTGKISDEELSFSKSTIINNLNTYYDDQRYMQMYALDCIYLGIPADIEIYKQKIEAVTKESVIKISEKIKENTVYFLAGKNN